MHFRTAVVAVGLGLSLLGCSGAGATGEPQEGVAKSTAALEPSPSILTVTERSEFAFSGTVQTDVGVVEFKAVRATAHRLVATAKGPGLTMTAEAVEAPEAEGEGHLSVEVEGGTLSHDTKFMLYELNAKLAELFGYPAGENFAGEGAPHEILLRNMAGFLSESPYAMPRGGRYDIDIGDIPDLPPGPGEDSPPPPVQCEINPNLDEGVRILDECCWNLTSRSYHWDTPASCALTGVGACGFSIPAECPGRCGPRCFTSSWYYKDCLDHDQCLIDNTGGSSFADNPICGDEFNEAVDDTLDSVARNLAAASFFFGSGIIVYQFACW